MLNAGGSRIHAFVVIGRPDGSSDRDIDSWGREAVVVCDPWDRRQAYAGYEIGTKMSLFTPGCYVELFRRQGAIQSRR